MVALPICDELRISANSADWEPMFILRCRREISQDVALVREINELYACVIAIVDERENFSDDLDMLVGSANSADWEPMFILRCRREISQDVALVREINELYACVIAIVDERENFSDDLDMLVGRSMPDKMAEFMNHGNWEWKLCDLTKEAREMAFEIESFLLKLMDKDPSHRRISEGLIDKEAVMGLAGGVLIFKGVLLLHWMVLFLYEDVLVKMPETSIPSSTTTTRTKKLHRMYRISRWHHPLWRRQPKSKDSEENRDSESQVKADIQKMEQPVIIAVISCRVFRYREMANARKPLLQELARASNLHDIRDQFSLLFRREIVKDSEKMTEYRRIFDELSETVRIRDEYIKELWMYNRCDEILESIKIMKSMHLDDIKKASRLLLMARETQISVHDKNNFIAKLRGLRFGSF
nr:hypothetical protein [Tanacetum cinerariifolium]